MVIILYFRLRIPEIESFYLNVNYSLVFFFDNPHKITILLYNPPNDEGNPGVFNSIVCIAILSHKPAEKILEVFRCIVERRAPPGISEDRCFSYHEDGTVDYIVPAINEFPQYFESYSRNILKELLRHTRNVVETLRWRLNIKGKHNYHNYRAFEYTFDLNNWFIVPIIPKFDVSTGEKLIIQDDISQTLYNELNKLINLWIGEPIAHELFREGWEQIFFNPRSALVLGIAAAETGFKHFIIELEPETEWIVKNIQSPPLKRMLLEYLPKLPVKCKIEGKILLPPKTIIDEIEKGISIRNDIVHKGSREIKFKTVKTVLLAVKDLLWLLDYYLGSEWAIKFIRPEIQEELIKENKIKKI